MNVLYFILAIATLFAVAVIVTFVKAALAGQWDDLETPAYRILIDDEPLISPVPDGDNECK